MIVQGFAITNTAIERINRAPVTLEGLVTDLTRWHNELKSAYPGATAAHKYTLCETLLDTYYVPNGVKENLLGSQRSSDGSRVLPAIRPLIPDMARAILDGIRGEKERRSRVRSEAKSGEINPPQNDSESGGSAAEQRFGLPGAGAGVSSAAQPFGLQGAGALPSSEEKSAPKSNPYKKKQASPIQEAELPNHKMNPQ
ncbi:hypothetical protein EBR57_03530 [bacterium]|nr:hypothetical protein [bacterium]